MDQLFQGEAVQVFPRGAEHTLLRGSMIRTKWTLQPLYRMCGFEIESAVHVLFTCLALEAVCDPSFAAEGDLVMFLGARWLNSRQWHSLFRLFLARHKDKTAEFYHDRGR